MLTQINCKGDEIELKFLLILLDCDTIRVVILWI